MEINEFEAKMDAYIAEIEKATDRACVIVAAAYLDDILSLLLKYFLTEGSKSADRDLFDGSGPLSTFSSKIKIAYRLGLISTFEYSLLEKIRTVRNRFAHDVMISTLEHEKVRGVIVEMIPPRRLLPPRSIPILKTDKGVDIIPLIGFVDKLNVEETSIQEYSGVVKDEQLPDIPIIDKDSCRDIFVKAISCLVNNISSRLFYSIRDKRKVPDDFYSLLEVMKARSKNEIDCSTILGKIEETILQINQVDEEIIKVKTHIKIAEENQDNDASHKYNKVLIDALSIKNRAEKTKGGLEKLFYAVSIQKFGELQIEKALQKERLI